MLQKCRSSTKDSMNKFYLNYLYAKFSENCLTYGYVDLDNFPTYCPTPF